MINVGAILTRHKICACAFEEGEKGPLAGSVCVLQPFGPSALFLRHGRKEEKVRDSLICFFFPSNAVSIKRFFRTRTNKAHALALRQCAIIRTYMVHTHTHTYYRVLVLTQGREDAT